MAFTRKTWTFSLIFVVTVLAGLLALPIAPVQAQSGATMTINPETAPQNSTITLELRGFRSDEDVNLWQTPPEGATVNLGNISVDDNGNANVSLFVSSRNPTGLHVFGARGNESLRTASATLELTLGEGAPPTSGVQIVVQGEIGPQLGVFTFTGSGYQFEEDVALWINLPDDTVQSVGRTRTDEQGMFQFSLSLGSSFPEGRYVMTAFGLESERTGIVPFTLTRGGIPPEEQPGPQVVVRPSQVRQGDIIAIEGSDFGRKESISLWATLQDGSVVPLPQYNETTEDGFFVFEYEIDPELFPAGTHELTAYGINSSLTDITTFTVLPFIEE
jgi:hypothetical protein